jgi:hypothetical protein
VSSLPDPTAQSRLAKPLLRQTWRPVLRLLAMGLGIRLVGIAQPFVDEWSWPQSDVAMVVSIPGGSDRRGIRRHGLGGRAPAGGLLAADSHAGSPGLPHIFWCDGRALLPAAAAVI